VLVFGVEASDSDAMAQSLDAGKRVTLPSVGLFADGAAVKTVGAECFRLVQAHADGAGHGL
jgi:threonine dehydratase